MPRARKRCASGKARVIARFKAASSALPNVGGVEETKQPVFFRLLAKFGILLTITNTLDVGY